MGTSKGTGEHKRKTGGVLTAIRPVKKRQSLAEAVYLALRTAILRGNLKPGERLVETKLSDLLRVSRIPIREAIQRLERNGFVERLSTKGFIVKEASESDTRYALSVLAILEGHAAARACKQMNGEIAAFLEGNIEATSRALERGNIKEAVNLDGSFHQAIIAAAGSSMLVHLIEVLRNHTERYRQDPSDQRKHARDALADHRALLKAMHRRDEALAEALAKAHATARLLLLGNRTCQTTDEQFKIWSSQEAS